MQFKSGISSDCGSTVTTDVPSEALYVARSKGRVIEGWVKKRGLIKGRRK